MRGMPIGKAIMIGAVALVATILVFAMAALVLFLFWKPVLDALLVGTGLILLVIAFIVLWIVLAGIILLLAYIGVFVQYWGKTAEVSTKAKGYSIKKAEEAGLREEKGG